jgi:hypothetical protein
MTTFYAGAGLSATVVPDAATASKPRFTASVLWFRPVVDEE